MKKLFTLMFISCLPSLLFAANSASQAPAVYQPSYVYGETPGGVYMGDPYDLGDDMMGDDMYMPDGESMKEHQTQSGEQEQGFQFVQGQEQLMEDNSKEALKNYNAEQQIGESMQQQYQAQINAQTKQPAQQPIQLPNM